MGGGLKRGKKANKGGDDRWGDLLGTWTSVSGAVSAGCSVLLRHLSNFLRCNYPVATEQAEQVQ